MLTLWVYDRRGEREGGSKRGRKGGRGILSCIFSLFFPRNLTIMRSRYDIGIHSFYGHIIIFNRFPNRLCLIKKKTEMKTCFLSWENPVNDQHKERFSSDWGMLLLCLPNLFIPTNDNKFCHSKYESFSDSYT